MTDINLLTRQSEDFLKKQSTLNLLRRLSFASLIIVAVSSLVVFFLKINVPLSQYRNEEASLLTQVSKYQDLIVQLYIIKNKLAIVSDIIDSRTDFTKQTSIIGSGPVNLPGLGQATINKDGLSFNVTTSSLGTVNSLLNSLIDLSEKKVIKSVTLESLNLSDSGYTVSVSIKL